MQTLGHILLPHYRSMVGAYLAFATCVSGACAGECVVSNELFTALSSHVTTNVVVVRQAKEIPGGKVQYFKVKPPSAPETEEFRYHAQINAALTANNLATFQALMPADPVGRQNAIRTSFALHTAFRNGATSIVDQILQWDPLALDAWSVKRVQAR